MGKNLDLNLRWQASGTAPLGPVTCGAAAILELAACLEPSPEMRVRWYLESPVACCDGMTPRELVECGRAHDVRRFLHQVLEQERIEWDTVSGGES